MEFIFLECIDIIRESADRGEFHLTCFCDQDILRSNISVEFTGKIQIAVGRHDGPEDVPDFVFEERVVVLGSVGDFPRRVMRNLMDTVLGCWGCIRSRV